MLAHIWRSASPAMPEGEAKQQHRLLKSHNHNWFRIGFRSALQYPLRELMGVAMTRKDCPAADNLPEDLLGFGAGLRSLHAKVGEKPKKEPQDPPDDFFDDDDDEGGKGKGGGGDEEVDPT
jgi:hypothetical protein